LCAEIYYLFGYYAQSFFSNEVTNKPKFRSLKSRQIFACAGNLGKVRGLFLSPANMMCWLTRPKYRSLKSRPMFACAGSLDKVQRLLKIILNVKMFATWAELWSLISRMNSVHSSSVYLFSILFAAFV